MILTYSHLSANGHSGWKITTKKKVIADTLFRAWNFFVKGTYLCLQIIYNYNTLEFQPPILTLIISLPFEVHTEQEHQNSTLDYGVGLQNAQTNCGVNKEKNMALPISNIYE